MKTVKFYTQWNKPPHEGEKNSGRDKVERAGYMSVGAQVINMQQAGRRLRMYRAEQFTYNQALLADPNYVSPVTRKDFDFMMADEQAKILTAKAVERKALMEQKKAEEVAKLKEKIAEGEEKMKQFVEKKSIQTENKTTE